MSARGPLRLLAVLFLLAGCGGDESGGAQPVSLALDFQPNAAHAGVFTAARTGIDADRGLHLRIRTPSASTDSLKLLLSGRADASIIDIHDLGLARERGVDVVGVGAIVQRPLAAVIAKTSVSRPRDLQGRRVGVTGLPSDDAVLRAVVESDGGDFSRVRRTTIGFSAVPSLVAGKVDAVVTFWNAEGVALRQRGVETREFRVDDFGAPRYPELVLAVTRRTLRERGGMVRDLVAALAEGTEEALTDPGAAAREIAAKSGADQSLVDAQLRAVGTALRPPLRLDVRQLRRWARFDRRFGILRHAPDVGRAFSPVRTP
jgi:NitT/TauT family transport system substrate-binding protein/putative hydroxymethylpyrimidine transport system substrate-binding protein